MQLLHILRQFKSIKSTLVNEDHLLAAFRWGALFTKTPQKFDTLFQGVKCIN